LFVFCFDHYRYIIKNLVSFVINNNVQIQMILIKTDGASSGYENLGLGTNKTIYHIPWLFAIYVPPPIHE